MRNRFRKIGMGIIYLILGGWVLVELYPVFYMYISSFKTDAEIVGKPFSIPLSPRFQNFIEVWRGGNVEVNFGMYFVNSIIITVGSLILLSVVALLCGYALARYEFPGRKLIYVLLVSMIAIPIHSLLIPIYSIGRSLNLLNNHFYVILVYTAFNLPFSVIIMRQYFESIPKSVEEAARIDGCSELQIFGRISVPMSFSAVSTLVIINVVNIWSELMFASVLLTEPNVRTLPIGIVMFASGMYSSSQAWQMASLVIATTPLLLIYFIFQRRIMQGMAEGSIK